MTIHKAQGLTVDELILSTKDLFGSGMGYTGLSRNKRIESLFLKDIHLPKFYCDPNVDTVLSQMKQFSTTHIFKENPNYLNILFHNIEGLQSNIIAFRNHYLTKKAGIICLVQTCQNNNQIHTDNLFEIEGYNFLHRTQFESYKENHALKLLTYGGIRVYIRNDIQIKNISLSQSINLEYIMIESMEKNILLIVCYRSPYQEEKEFLENFKYLLTTIDLKKRILIIGDFNENSFSHSNKIIQKAMHNLGFINMFHRVSTTNDQTSIDCIYTNFISKKDYHCQVNGSFYSYHEPLCISVDLHATSVDLRKEIEDLNNIELKAPEKDIKVSNFAIPPDIKRKKRNKLSKKIPIYDKTKKKSYTTANLINEYKSNNTSSSFPSSSETDLNVSAIGYAQEKELNILNTQMYNTGLQIVKILGDGNCFFRAISYQIHKHEDSHFELRVQSMNYIRMNKTEFEDFLNTEYNNIDEYINRMSKLNTYADNLVIRATAIIIKRNIVIHRARDIPSLISTEQNTNEQVHIVYHRHSRHYDSVHRLDGSLLQLPLNDVRIV